MSNLTIAISYVIVIISLLVIATFITLICLLTHKPNTNNMYKYDDVIRMRPTDINLVMFNGRIYVFNNNTGEEIGLSRLDQLRVYLYSMW